MVLIHHHLGLGDHLICNGLVNHLADQHDVVYLPSKRAYLASIRCLYSEQPKVHVFPVDEEQRDVEAFARDNGCDILRVGFEHCDRERFDASFYEQLNIPFEVRYDRFALPNVIPHEQELYERLAPTGEYCLVHRESSGGIFDLTIESALPRVYIERRTDPFGNLLASRTLIREATEIHCINSSMLHLVDGLSPRARLVYHEVRKTNFTLRPCWTTVRYGTSPAARAWRGAMARVRRATVSASGSASIGSPPGPPRR